MFDALIASLSSEFGDDITYSIDPLKKTFFLQGTYEKDSNTESFLEDFFVISLANEEFTILCRDPRSDESWEYCTSCQGEDEIFSVIMDA